MRDARTGIGTKLAVLAAWVLAGCVEAPIGEATPVATEASRVDLPRTDEPLRRFRMPRFEGTLTGDPEARPVPGVFRADRPSEPRESFERARGAEGDGADRRDLPGDDCFQRCADDATCRVACLDGLPDERAGGDDDCLECGRETGFLPRPTLWVESVFEGKAVVLRWTRIDDADRYVVYGTQLPYEGGSTGPVSLSWQTRSDSLRAELDPGFIYVFYVVAISDDGVQSKPSRPVTVRL